MVYFTADMHFGHRAIINMQSRPFESVEEMNRVLLQNFNSVVHKDDTVYILGDICHHMKIEDADELIRKMNGKKYLIIGNHDKKYDPRLFEDIRDFMKVSLRIHCIAKLGVLHNGSAFSAGKLAKTKKEGPGAAPDLPSDCAAVFPRSSPGLVQIDGRCRKRCPDPPIDKHRTGW